MIETGLCDNRTTVSVEWIENAVIEGIESQLAAPDMIAEYVREYHRACLSYATRTGRRRAALERKLAKIAADTKATIDMLLESRNKARRASPCLRRLMCGNRDGGRVLSEIVRNHRGILNQVRARALFHDLAAFHYVCIG